jgi:hypothetical protein
MTADPEDELRTPDIFKAVSRRTHNVQAFQAPEQREINSDAHNHGDSRARNLTHDALPLFKVHGYAHKNANSKETKPLPYRARF